MNVKMNKKQKSALYVYIILLLLYMVLYFAIPFPKSGASYIMFFFSLVSFFVGYVVLYIAFRGTKTLQSKVYGFPVFRIGYLYLMAQLGFSALLYMIGIWAHIPEWIPTVLSVVLLCLSLVGVIVVDNTRDVIEQMEETLEVQTKPMMYFHLDVASLEMQCPDGEMKKDLQHFIENVKYSDPVSSEALTEIENELRAEVEKLRNIFTQGEDGRDQIKRLEYLLADRNRRCKEYKQMR